MWYVLQTITGQEEELVEFIRILLSDDLYESCFVIKAEWMKRLGGIWKLQVGALFPGYVFIHSNEPEKLFMKLKKVPRFSKMLGNEKYEFIAVSEEERRYLETITGFSYPELVKSSDCGESRIVRLSEVEVSGNGRVSRIEGPLQLFRDKIIQMNLHKRFAVVERPMFGKKQTLIFGIKLGKDGEGRCIKSI